jgi:hypothetical protein
LAGNVRNGWHKVDGATGNEHGRFAGKDAAGSLVNILRSNCINAITVLGESKITEGHEVASDLFKTLILTLHGHDDIHLENVLGTSQFLVWNRFTQSVKFLEHNLHELSRVRARALNLHTEEARVCEVRVDS